MNPFEDGISKRGFLAAVWRACGKCMEYWRGSTQSIRYLYVTLVSFIAHLSVIISNRTKYVDNSTLS
jgi:hypothetical protein